MAPTSHNPDDRGPWPELGELLRPAVEQVRKSVPPPDALDRALERARQLPPPRRPRWISQRTSLLVAGALAATLLLGLGVRYGSYPLGGYLARNRPDAGQHHVSARRLDPTMFGVVRPDSRAGKSTRGAGRVFTFGQVRDDDLAVRVGQLTPEADDWERIQALRHLGQGMSAIDRKGLETYLRHLSHPVTADTLRVWRNDGKPLPHARVHAGDGRSLALQGVSVQVLVEGPRARTLVDHVFHNPDGEPLVGTFEYSLPDGSSPSFFALFPGNKTNSRQAIRVIPLPGKLAATRLPTALPTPAEKVGRIDPFCWGQPRQARVVTAPRALEPAGDLALAVANPGDEPPTAPSGNVFRGSIGSVLGKSHIRILLAYEETLPIRNGRLLYQYPMPTCNLHDLTFTLQTDPILAAGAVVVPEDARREESEGRVTFRRTWRKVKPQGVVAFAASPLDPTVQTTSCEQGDSHYLIARLRPNVPVQPAPPPFARHAIFVLDTSAGENPARFDRCVKLMRAVLEADRDIAQFNVLTVNSAASWLAPRAWLPNTKEGREMALSRLDGIVLEGNTALAAAFDRLLAFDLPLAKGTPLHCFLGSDGRPSGSESDLTVRATRLQMQRVNPMRWHCYLTGLNDENAELFGLLTRNGGGVYRCLTDKDVPAAAEAHRRPCLVVDRLRFVGGPSASDVLVAGRRAAVHPGGELLVAARFAAPGKTRVVVEGTLGGKPVVHEFPLVVGNEGQLAARGWGELAVGSLLSLNDPRLEPVASAYAARFGIASRVSVFALPADGRLADVKDDPVPPLESDLGDLIESCWQALAKPVTPGQRRNWLSGQVAAWVTVPALRRDLRALVNLLPASELTLPPIALEGGLSHRAPGDAVYLAARQRDPKAIEPYLAEADRRRAAGQDAAAVRCLCSLLEQHPGNADVARMVGYHLVATGHAALAARVLHEQVEQYPGDPAIHRAFAVALDEAKSPVRAALHYEVTLALLGGQSGWHGAVTEEYVHLLRRAVADSRLPGGLRDRLETRRKELDRGKPGQLRVSVTWGTTASRVELWVTDPTGKKILVPEPAKGTTGTRTGPRRYTEAEGKPGEYQIEVRLARATPETTPETLVTVMIARNEGTSEARYETKRVLLRKVNEQVLVGKAGF